MFKTKYLVPSETTQDILIKMCIVISINTQNINRYIEKEKFRVVVVF